MELFSFLTDVWGCLPVWLQFSFLGSVVVSFILTVVIDLFP